MEKLLLVIKQVIELFTKDILITTHYLMVLVVVIRKLRHRGKKRHTKGYVENRGKISISHTIQERPKDANNRTRIGDWEDDTVTGKTGKSVEIFLCDKINHICWYFFNNNFCKNIFCKFHICKFFDRNPPSWIKFYLTIKRHKKC